MYVARHQETRDTQRVKTEAPSVVTGMLEYLYVQLPMILWVALVMDFIIINQDNLLTISTHNQNQTKHFVDSFLNLFPKADQCVCT